MIWWWWYGDDYDDDDVKPDRWIYHDEDVNGDDMKKTTTKTLVMMMMKMMMIVIIKRWSNHYCSYGNDDYTNRLILRQKGLYEADNNTEKSWFWWPPSNMLSLKSDE